MAELNTVDSVIEALGGNAGVSELTGLSMQAVSNWKFRGSIPPEHFMVISTALGDDKADPAVFGFKSREVAE